MKLARDASTKDRILASALDLFARQGFAGTSMRQIAAEVGIQASSLYNHFPGKEALFSALIEAHGPAHSASWLVTPAYRALKHDPAALMQRYTRDLLDQWCDSEEQRFMLLLNSYREDGGAERDHFRETLFAREAGALTDYFRAFALKGLIYAPDPKECARLFIAGLTLLRLEHFLIPARPSPRATVAKALNRFVDHFLTLTAPRAR